jgi:3-oxoacyl-(acyl-carrier-protein) synthase
MSSSLAAATGDLAFEAPGPDHVILAQALWPGAPTHPLPAIPGFVTSSFSPLVVEVAQRCLHAYFGAAPADPAKGERTAVVLASSTGDLATAAAVAQAVGQERRVPPMLFYQSTPNAVVGYLTARWGLHGPVVCTVPLGDAMADARACADLIITSGDADAALVVVADQARTASESDRAQALLIGPSSWAGRDEVT